MTTREWLGLELGPRIPSTEFFAPIAAHGLPKNQPINTDSQVGSSPSKSDFMTTAVQYRYSPGDAASSALAALPLRDLGDERQA